MTIQSMSFLQPDAEQIKHQVRGILDSYSHDWDVLAELSQNSVDAIARADPPRGHIQVHVDAIQRVIEFSDNGCGIDPSKLQKLLRPFGTDKLGLANQIGQKGVGLTFILFSTVSFEITSHHELGSVRARVEGANAWLHAETASELLVELETINPVSSGLTVKLKLSSENHPLWDLSFDQLVFALRTRTALGNTSFIWSEVMNSDFRLSHVDKSAKRREREFDCKYLLPIEGLKKEDAISLDDYVEWRTEGDRSDQEKRRKLLNKIVYRSGKRYQAGRDLKFWACFVPNRAQWALLSRIHGLDDGSNESPDFTNDELLSGFAFTGGLYTSGRTENV